MFRASLCPSSGAQEYYTVVAVCGISCCKNVKNIFFLSFCGICVLSLKCRVLFRFVTRFAECLGGCVWVFLVGFLVYILVCGSGIQFVGCDCMTVDVVDSCMHLKWRSTYLWFFQVRGLVWSRGLCVRFAGCWFTGSVLWYVWCGWLKASSKRGFGSFRHCSGISLCAWWRDWMWNSSWAPDDGHSDARNMLSKQ